MSTTHPQPGQVSQIVFSIVSKGRKNKSLRCVSVFYVIPTDAIRPIAPSHHGSCATRSKKSWDSPGIHWTCLNTKRLSSAQSMMPWCVCLSSLVPRQCAHESAVPQLSLQQSEQAPGTSAGRDRKKTGKSGSTPKTGESGRSSLSKSAKSKVCRERFNRLFIVIIFSQEVISDSDSAVEPTPSTSRSNVKLDMSADANEVLYTPT